MSANKLALVAMLATTGAIALAAPATASAQPASVEVSITQKGDYTASLCAADQLEGRCQDNAKKGETKKFTVKPGRGKIEIRAVVNGGGSDVEFFDAEGAAMSFETSGSPQNPVITKAAGAQQGHDHGTAPTQAQPAPDQPKPPAPAPAKGKPFYLSADLDGKQEVPAPNGAAVGDEDGSAKALVEVRGDRITFALDWKNTSPLTLGHIHEGVAGQNGAVKVPLFGTAMPDTITSAAGQVIVDAKLAEDIRKNPQGFYVNLHSTEFGGGAVRGQLKPLTRRVNPLDIIKGGKLHAFANGAQEVPVAGGPAVGDKDGQAVTFVQPRGANLDFSLAWVNIAAPTLGHVHQGAAGQNGAVKITFFGTAIPQGIFAVSGSVANADKTVLDELRKNPKGFYSNIHTGEFPGGAVRGQFFG
ncbi:MAG: hypothetical protein QOF58_1417 [Pseudonocardiales bacterium]|nr:hypothetical protein [Pseudonocardiales bacterium]